MIRGGLYSWVLNWGRGLIFGILRYLCTTKENQKIPSVSSGLFSDMSDHLPCFLIQGYPLKIPKRPRPEIRVYNELSKQKFTTDLQTVDWSPAFNNDNPGSSFKTFLDTYKRLHDKHLSLSTISISYENISLVLEKFIQQI